MRLKVVESYIETDINNDPHIVMVDEKGEEWVNCYEWAHHAHARETVIIKKSQSWYFDEANKK